MSLQYQAAAPHAADVRRHHQWAWFATAGRSKKENGNAAYSHSRPTGAEDEIVHRIRTRETEIGERERAGVRENKGVQMSGRPAWPQQNVLPDLLPSSDSYRAIYRYGAEPGSRERSARLHHHRPGSTARMWRRGTKKTYLCARARKRDVGMDRDGGLCGHESSTSLRLSGAVSDVGLCLAATRREVHHPVTTSAVSRQIRNWLYLLTYKKIKFSRRDFFPIIAVSLINKFVDFFF